MYMCYYESPTSCTYVELPVLMQKHLHDEKNMPAGGDNVTGWKLTCSTMQIVCWHEFTWQGLVQVSALISTWIYPHSSPYREQLHGKANAIHNKITPVTNVKSIGNTS